MLELLFGRRVRPKPFLDEDVQEWHLTTWALLLERFGGEAPFRETPLVLPTPDYFPATEAQGHERVQHILRCVMNLMGIGDWPCRLEALPERRGGMQVGAFLTLEGEDEPNGTFHFDADGVAVISYSPELLERTSDLVATLAHEAAHYLLSGQADLVEDETHELATDLMVAYTGFGLFGANAAFSFAQHGDAFSQGWMSRRSGYLSPRSWAFALAVFAALKGDDGDMDRWLKPEVAQLRKAASRYLERYPQVLEGVRRVLV